MTCTDCLGFASMTLLLIGGANWGVVAIRYWVVFASGVIYAMLFIWNSIELRTVEK